MNDDDEDEDGNDEKTGDTAVHTKTAYNARNVRGYQSDRHSTETAHERLNAQLAGFTAQESHSRSRHGNRYVRAEETGGGSRRD
jgi:hypothetical protein